MLIMKFNNCSVPFQPSDYHVYHSRVSAVINSYKSSEFSTIGPSLSEFRLANASSHRYLIKTVIVLLHAISVLCPV